MQNEITELRNQVRTLKRIVYGFGCLLVTGVIVGATSLQMVPDVIQAKSFEVVTDEGKVLVELRNLVGGGVDNGMIVTRTSEGQQLVELGANPNGGMVVTSNDKGGTLVTLGANKNEGGLITSYSGKGVALAAIGAGPDGDGVVVTYDKDGKGRITSIAPAP